MKLIMIGAEQSYHQDMIDQHQSCEYIAAGVNAGQQEEQKDQEQQEGQHAGADPSDTEAKAAAPAKPVIAVCVATDSI